MTLPSDVTITQVLTFPDGKLFVAGTHVDDSVYVERFLPRGQVDSSFDQAKFALAVQGIEKGSDFTNIGVDSRGRVLVSYVDGQDDTSPIIRLNSDGSRDLTFGTNGQTNTTLGVSAISALPDGRIIVRGVETETPTDVGHTEQTAILVLKSNGSVDTAFNDTGIAETAFLTTDDSDLPSSTESVPRDAIFDLPNSGFLYLQDVEQELVTSDRINPNQQDVTHNSDTEAFAFNPDGSPATSFKFDRKDVLRGHSTTLLAAPGAGGWVD